MYLGSDEGCTFIETFGDSRGEDGAIEIAQAELGARCLSYMGLPPDLQVVDITGPGLARIGADGRLCSGDRYDLSRRWSRALWDHPSHPDGICYRARHDQEKVSLALFDRVQSHLITESRQGSLAHPQNTDVLTRILTTYRVSLIP
jgi:hypothetical protein